MAGRLNFQFSMDKLLAELHGLLAAHSDALEGNTFRHDPASERWQFDLKRTSGDFFVENYENVYRKYSVFGLQEMTDEAEEFSHQTACVLESLTPSQRLMGMLDTASSYYHPLYDERNYTKPTQYLRGYFAEVLNSFGGRACRTSVVVLRPGEGVSQHFDIGPEFVTRVHVPLITNPDARIGVRGSDGQWNEFHFPADGGVYFVNAGLEHYACNMGSQNRFHLRICFNGQEDLENMAAMEPVRVITPEEFKNHPGARRVPGPCKIT